MGDWHHAELMELVSLAGDAGLDWDALTVYERGIVEGYSLRHGGSYQSLVDRIKSMVDTDREMARHSWGDGDRSGEEVQLDSVDYFTIAKLIRYFHESYHAIGDRLFDRPLDGVVDVQLTEIERGRIAANICDFKAVERLRKATEAGRQ